MKTNTASKSTAPTLVPSNGHESGIHALNVETLRTAVDALLRGDFEAAQAAIQQRRDSTLRPIAAPAPTPPELETIAPDFVQAAADATVAWELYQEAWKRRQGLLEAVLAKHGPTQVRFQGEPFWIVRRVRNGKSAVFLRHAR